MFVKENNRIRNSREMIQVGNVDTKGHNSIWGRVYSPDGISATINSGGGGLGAKTGLYRVHNLQPRTSKLQAGGTGPLSKADGTAYCLDRGNSQAVEKIEEPRACLTPNRAKKRQNGRRLKEENEPMFTLTKQDVHGVTHKGGIRRLTPVECERLQGFPDNYTARGLDDSGNEIEISDSQRYKAIGNAMTVDIVGLVMQKLQKAR